MPDEKKSRAPSKNQDTVVFPADKIGIEEQFLPSKNSTYLEDHEVRAAVPGKLFIDQTKYRAKVFPFQKMRTSPQRYDVVIGQVIKVSRSSLRINIHYLNKVAINPSASAIMHISDASKDYIEDLDDYYASGDIIRATIIDAKTYPLQLEAKKSDNGVIYTMCIKCGGEVEKIRKNLLNCLNCGYRQSRATSIDFGKIKFTSQY